MATYSSNSVFMLSGRINIVLAGDALQGPDTQFKIMKGGVGDLEFKYDVPTNSDSPFAIQIIMGSMDLTISDETTDGRNLIDMIEANMVTGNDLTATTVFRDRTGTFTTDHFNVKKEGITYDEKKKTLKLTLNPKAKEDVLYNDYWGNYTGNNAGVIPVNGIYQRGQATIGGQTVYFYTQRTQQFILDILKYYGNGSQYYLSIDHNGPLVTGDGVNIIWMDQLDPSPMPILGNSTLLQNLATLAAISGGFFGWGFGRGFFVNRLDTSDQVAIDWAKQVNDCKIIKSDRIYNKVVVETYKMNYFDSGSTWDHYATQKVFSVENQFADKDFLVQFPYLCMTQRTIDQDGINTTLALNTSLAQTLQQNAVDAYAKATGADGSRRIQIEVVGVATIRPWQSFTLSGAPARYANRVYRPSEISYDRNNDVTKMKAYQIA